MDNLNISCGLFLSSELLQEVKQSGEIHLVLDCQLENLSQLLKVKCIFCFVCSRVGLDYLLAGYRISGRITGYCGRQKRFVTKSFIVIELRLVGMSVFPSVRLYVCPSANLSYV